MKNISGFILLSFILLVTTASCRNKQSSEPVSLNVMSFNIWMGGGKSIEATADVLVNSGADIVGIQEATRKDQNTAKQIADSLNWHSYVYGRSTAIISKYPIVDTSENKQGVKIKIDDSHFVWMFNVHLIYCPYEPYQLNGIEYCGAPFLSTEAEAIESAKKSREKEVKSNISDILTVQKEGYPVFLTGDFNEPSCLDWTDKAVEAKLCKIAVAWPSTKAFIDAGLKDSYREKYPDEVKDPGHTWTTLPETKAYTEVLDRIDFVFFSGDNIKLENSQIVGEESPLSNIKFNKYPSDHRAVLSTFTIE